MAYMRIEKNKFWGWVVVSLLVGLGIGLTIMFIQSAGRTAEVNKLKSQLTAQSEEASSTIVDLQARISSAEASIADFTAKNSQLTSDLAAAQAALAAAKTATTNSGTLTITSRSVSPSTVTSSTSKIKLTVKVKGSATKVRMQITGPGGYNKLYTLSKQSTSGGVQTWGASVAAPTKKGTYSYFTGAYIDTKKFTASSRTFVVK